MDIRTFRFCAVARRLALSHGRYYAAVFLCENHIDIDVALAVLVQSQVIQLSSSLNTPRLSGTR
jgi:hypothetical protein